MGCDPKFAIREVSEMTGVKPVTLRAWQRRYGLLQPQRTEKGHRLYSDQDIELIHKIQAWLEKGVSIGKVKELLKSGNDPEIEPRQNAQLEEVETLLDCLSKLQYSRCEQVLGGLFKEYPGELVIEQGIRPVLSALKLVKNTRQSLQAGLFSSVVSSVVHKVVEAEHKAGKKPKMLLISFDPFGSVDARMQMLRLVEQGHRVVLIEQVEDLVGLKEMLSSELYQGVCFFASHALPARLTSELESLELDDDIEVEISPLIRQLHFGEGA